MATTTKKIYVNLNAADAQPVEGGNKWDIDVTLWGVTNKISVIVNHKPEVRVSKTSGNEYLVGGQIIVPGLSSNVILFYSKEYNYSNAKIGEGNSEIRINLYSNDGDFRSARGGPGTSKSSGKNYKLMFKYEEEDDNGDKEFDFGTGEDITPKKEPVISVKSTNYENLPF